MHDALLAANEYLGAAVVTDPIGTVFFGDADLQWLATQEASDGPTLEPINAVALFEYGDHCETHLPEPVFGSR
jgi:hypothetical protein